jgi:PhoH-like ATPase
MTTNNNYSIRDIVVFDTSVILYDANSIFGFENHDIVIPLVVLDEVDKFRSLDSEVGRNARSFIRSLNTLIGSSGVLSEGVERLPSGERLKVKFLEFGELLDTNRVLNLDKNDDKILAVCLEIISESTQSKVSLVTKDISLLAKANVLTIDCVDYQADSQVKDPSQLYTGLGELIVPGHMIDKLFTEGRFSFLDMDVDYTSELAAFENMGVTLVNESKPSHTALAVYKNGYFNKLAYSGKTVCNVKPQNREQMFAFELMFDPDVKLVTLTGPAGVGKTLLAVAAGIHMVADKNMYDKIVVSRPIQPLGKDIGYLPGTMEEKLDPWMGPIKDAAEFVFGGDRGRLADLMHFGVLEIEPLTYIRGRSLPRTLFIFDEAQNSTRHEMKTLISRIGKDSKIILSGDVFQIDNHYLDTSTNGLTCVAEKFKFSSLAGHVTMHRGQRSELATLAAEIL